MKIVFAILATFLTTSLSHADCMGQAEVANSFMNEYKKFIDKSKSNESRDKWIQRSKKISDEFKNSYKLLVESAKKSDPEIGLEFDPIFDAQDYPDQGFKILSCDEKSNYVTLKGVDWDDFTVVLKTIKTERAWLIDGAGAINIPKNKRAKR